VIINERGEICVRFTIRMISPSRLRVKGPPKLAIIRINHIIDICGDRVSTALFSPIAREWVRSYIILAVANMPDEHTPCAIITMAPPSTPILYILITPTIIKAM